MTNLNDYYAEQIADEAARRLEQPELKPCPFCGGEATSKLAPYIGGGGCGYIVDCDKCWSETGYYSQRDQAIEAWNNRAERTCQLLRLENEDVCSFCGYAEEVDSAYIPNNYCPNCGAKVVD